MNRVWWRNEVPQRCERHKGTFTLSKILVRQECRGAMRFTIETNKLYDLSLFIIAMRKPRRVGKNSAGICHSLW